MKCRDGFVSNSSSSSFVIGLKKGVKLKDALEVLGVEDHPFACLVDSMISAFEYEADKQSEQDVFSDYGVHTMAEFLADAGQFGDDCVEIWGKGMDLYEGSFSDEDGGVKAFLCDADFDYEDDNIIIKKDGGY
jgi:hypothetical protein